MFLTTIIIRVSQAKKNFGCSLWNSMKNVSSDETK